MTRSDTIEPEFVEEIPRDLEFGKLYISILYGTATHSCCCGCGAEVVTPIHPTGWTLAYDGDTVSLDPSVGSWGLSCRSHYVIRKNRVRWAAKWSSEKIKGGRVRDAHAVDEYFSSADGARSDLVRKGPPGRPRLGSLWRRLTRRSA